MSIKLLICDDEKLIRQGLAALDWEERGIEVVGTAKNGEEGFELFKELTPDIVISDIRMPKKDGIWLSEQICSLSSDTRMVFLTGYNEFEYAQSAVNNGVCRYLLKPIDEFKLYAIIDELAADIRVNRQSKEKMIELHNMLTKSRYFLLNYLFNHARSGTIDYELFEIEPDPKNMCATVIKFDDAAADGNISFMVFEDLLKSLPENINIIPFFCDSELVFMCFFDCDTDETERRLFAFWESVNELINNRFNCNYNIGIGNITEAPFELEASYNSALQALSYSKGLGNKNIIYINDIEPMSQLSSYQTKLIDMYIKSLKNHDEKQTRRELKELFDSMKRSGTSLYNQQRRCLSLILAISDALYDMDCDPAILFKNTDAWSLIRKSSSTEELRKFTEDITEVIIEHIAEIQRQKAANIITKVKDLVENNYADDASLETVASQVYISPCYLSVIFKKETGITFKNYLIKTRIDKAKELLSDTDLKIYEIAERVGYTDTRYFSELFQRVCGKTPSQYRNKNR